MTECHVDTACWLCGGRFDSAAGQRSGSLRSPRMDGARHTRYGWWLEEAGPVAALPPLEEDTTADVVVVGGGYLGLWTAWQLKALEPACARRRPRRGSRRARAEVAATAASSRRYGTTCRSARPRRRRARARRRTRVRARGAGDRRVVRGRGRRCVVPRGTDARRRDARGAARRLGRRDRGLCRPRSARGGAPDQRRRAPRALRCRLPRRCDPAHVCDRPSSPTRAGASRESGRGRDTTARADARPAARRRRGRRHATWARPRGRRRARREQRDGGLSGVPPRARRRVEPFVRPSRCPT